MNKRVFYIDTLSGLLICYMMLCHILLRGLVNCSVDNIWLEPLQFFMFWFFFKSGMFYAPKISNDLFVRGGGKLLIPLLVYSLIGHIVECIKLFVNGDLNWKHYLLTPFKEFVCTGSVTGNQPLWFLFSLFIVQLLFNELFVRKTKPILILLLSLLIPIVLFYCGDNNLFIYLANVPLGMAAYTCGYMIKEKQFEKSFFFPALMIYLGVMLLQPSHLVFRSNTLNSGGHYLLAIAFSLSACVVFNNVFKKLPNCSWLQFIGKNSMTYYVTHWIILNICSLVMINGFHCQNIWVFVVMAMSCLIIPTLIIKLKN